jgi:hypothetical protein
MQNDRNDIQNHRAAKNPDRGNALDLKGQRSQARSQQDSVDMQQIEGQQPAIPKVGSRDAPGG